jgi:hypothetical protein
VDVKVYTLDPVSRAAEPPFLVGRTSDGAPVVLGLYGWEVVGLWFTADGSLRELRVRPFTPDENADPEVDYDVFEETCRIRREWAGEVGLLPGAIRVRRFILGQYKIGVLDLPNHLEEYRDDPTLIPPAERVKWEARLAAWQADGRFVLYWLKEHYMAADGRMLST